MIIAVVCCHGFTNGPWNISLQVQPRTRYLDKNTALYRDRKQHFKQNKHHHLGQHSHFGTEQSDRRGILMETSP